MFTCLKLFFFNFAFIIKLTFVQIYFAGEYFHAAIFLFQKFFLHFSISINRSSIRKEYSFCLIRFLFEKLIIRSKVNTTQVEQNHRLHR